MNPPKLNLSTKELSELMEEAVLEYAHVYNEHNHTLLIDKTIIDAFRLGMSVILGDVAGYPEDVIDEAMDLTSRNKNVKDTQI